MKRFFSIILTVIYLIPCWGFSFRINNQEVERGQTLNIFYEDLKEGKILFSLEKEPQIKKVEISLDGGKTWDTMQNEENGFIFEYRPLLKQQEIKPVFLISYKNGGAEIHNPYIRILYKKEKPEKAVLFLLEKMKRFYEQEKKDRFLDLFSYKFADRIEFEEAIQRDFYNYNNIRLLYRVDKLVFNPRQNKAILNVYWKKKYDTRLGSSQSQEAELTIQLEKEGINWKITGLKNNTIFGSSLLTPPDLKITGSDLSKTGASIINATIHNIGNTSASNVKVEFYYFDRDTSTWKSDGYTTISLIKANQNKTITHNYSKLGGWGYTDIKVIIDPDNTIPEGDETNNEAQKTFYF
jgi:hypothetical protein